MDVGSSLIMLLTYFAVFQEKVKESFMDMMQSDLTVLKDMEFKVPDLSLECQYWTTNSKATITWLSSCLAANKKLKTLPKIFLILLLKEISILVMVLSW